VLTRLQAPQHQQAAARPGHNPSICSGYRVIDPGFARFVPGIDPRSTKIYQVKIKFFFVDPVIIRTIVRFRPALYPVSTREQQHRPGIDRDRGIGIGMSGSGCRGRGSGYMYIYPYLYIYYL